MWFPTQTISKNYVSLLSTLEPSEAYLKTTLLLILLSTGKSPVLGVWENTHEIVPESKEQMFSKNRPLLAAICATITEPRSSTVQEFHEETIRKNAPKSP